MRPKDAFMGFDYPYENAKTVILPAPYQGTSTYLKGQQNGPNAILSASLQVETYDMELQSDYIDQISPHTLPALKMQNLQAKEAVDMVQDATNQILNDNKFPLIFGGEHSVSIGSIQAAYAHFENDLSVLQIDAHSDMRDQYQGSKYNHACVMSRTRELVDAVSVGIRSQSLEEAQLIKEKYSDVVFGPSLDSESLEKILCKIKTKNVYITIDVDGFDPSIIPATGTPEPGGLQWAPTLNLLKNVARKKNVIGADIVELAPRKNEIVSDFICARLAYKLLAYCLL